MSTTYTQLRYHLVFSTKHRMPLITSALRDNLYDYLGGVLRGNGGVLLAVGGMPDHVHLLAGWGTTLSVAEMLKLLKGASSRWINDQSKTNVFSWQEGYGAFTVSESSAAKVCRYIHRQEEHHRRRSFEEEWVDLLKRHNIEFDPADPFGERRPARP